MPALATHYFFGQEVLKRLPQEIHAFICSNKSAFDLGLQGPDILFYYKPFKPNEITKLGSYIHWQNAEKIINSAILAIKETKDDLALSYLLGFACHFILDSSLHSDISRIAPKIKDHFLLEAEMDRQIISKNYLDKPYMLKRYKLIKTCFWRYDWLQIIYPNVKIKKLKKCVRSIAFYQRFLYSRGDIKKKLLIFMEKALKKDGTFTSMMINKQKNEKFSRPVSELCKKLDGIFIKGVVAIKNIYGCMQSDIALHSLFNKNFE